MLSLCILPHVTVRNSSHNLFTPYKHLLPSLRQLFCCQKEDEEKGKKTTFRTPAPSASPRRPLMHFVIRLHLCLVTSLHLIPPLTPGDPAVAPSTQGTAHRSSGNYPLGLEVARPKGTRPLSAVSKALAAAVAAAAAAAAAVAATHLNRS